MQHHRHQEFIRFLDAIEAQVPARKEIHAIVDNYATHKHPKVRQWLARHPRWTFHFTPTSASWLNAVEGFFAKLMKRRLKRGKVTKIPLGAWWLRQERRRQYDGGIAFMPQHDTDVVGDILNTWRGFAVQSRRLIALSQACLDVVSFPD